MEEAISKTLIRGLLPEVVEEVYQQAIWSEVKKIAKAFDLSVMATPHEILSIYSNHDQ